MTDFMKNLFGPLGKEYCIWFYFLSVLAIVALILFLISAVYKGITTKKDLWYYLGVLAVAFMYFFSYLQSRILYSMCSGTMK
jgi:amino acid transporter